MADAIYVRRKARIYEIVSMVEEEKEKSSKEVHTVVWAVFIPERKKRMGVSLGRQKARIKHKKTPPTEQFALSVVRLNYTIKGDMQQVIERGIDMTRVEAVERLKSIKSLVDKYDDVVALREAIKALSQQAKDAISRQAVFNIIEKEQFKGDAIAEIEKLPSVNPQEPKTGHWITVTNGRGGHECSLCHEYAPSYQSGDEWLTKYCPGCGCRMFEPQESEDNEDIPIEYFESGGC